MNTRYYSTIVILVFIFKDNPWLFTGREQPIKYPIDRKSLESTRKVKTKITIKYAMYWNRETASCVRIS